MCVVWSSVLHELNVFDYNDYLRCESCIDRLFTLGPAPCPLCNKVLRKLAFMPQTFEDLGVEKEVAIRRRIAKEFVMYGVRMPRKELILIGLTNDAKISPICEHIMTTSKKSKT